MTETFSFYKGGIWEITPTSEMDVPHFLDLIKSDTYQSIVQKLRQLPTKDAQRELKRTSPEFDYVTIGGTFSSRGKERITQCSGLLCVDIDDIDQAANEKEKLKSNKFVHGCFISPSGKGLKVIARIPADAEKYEGYFLAFAKSLGINLNLIDKATRDISRACFLSYDPEPYYNTQSETWTSYYEQTEWQEIEFSKDKSRSGYEFREVVKLIYQGKTMQDVQKIATTQKCKWDNVVAWEKWNSDGKHYQEETYKKATQYVQAHPQSFVTAKELVEKQKIDSVIQSARTIADILKNGFPKIKWRVENLIPAEGVCVFGGQSDSFKTWSAMELAMSVSTGQPWFGKFKVEQCNVIYCDEENGQVLLFNRFGRLFKGRNIEPTENLAVTVFQDIKLDTKTGAKTLRELADKFDAHLVVIDSLVRSMAGEEDKSDSVRKIFDFIKKYCMADRQDLAFVIIHHTVKAVSKGNLLLNLRGSSDIGAFCNSVIMFQRIDSAQEGGVFAVNIAKNRWIDKTLFPDFIMTAKDIITDGEKTGIYFEFNDYQNSERMEESARKELIEWIKREEKVIVTTRSACEYLTKVIKCSRRTVYSILQDLVEAGILQKEKRGIYSYIEERQQKIDVEDVE